MTQWRDFKIKGRHPNPYPQSIEAEQSVLGSILIDSNCIEEVASILSAHDFYRTSHRQIYDTMLEMKEQGIPIDILTLFENLKSKGQSLDEVGGSIYITYLTEIVPSSANVVYYVMIVKRKAKERFLQRTLEDMKYKLTAGDLTFEEAIKELYSRIEEKCDQANPSLKPISARDLDGRGTIDSLWGNVIFPKCITQINSVPGVGKTTFAYNLSVFGAHGSRFLDVEYSKPLKVLYVDLETPEWLRENKLKIICSVELPENLYFLNDLNLESNFQGLLSLCQRENYDLVIFDTQSRVFGMEQENDNAEANRIMELLRLLTNRTGAALILIHHTTKSDRQGVYSGRGASAIAGAVDVVINLEALDQDTLKLVVAKNRVLGDYPTLFVRKLGEDRFEQYIPPNEVSSGFEIFKAQDFILSLWERNAKQILTTSGICRKATEVGFTEITVKRSLSKLVQSGKLVRVSHGKYKINPALYQNIKPISPKGDMVDIIDTNCERDPWDDCEEVVQ